MKSLIVEDDYSSRLLLQELLKGYGPTHIAVNGKEAIEAVRAAIEANEPYDLICLDIMMPEMDGQTALKEIRSLEEDYSSDSRGRARIIITSALSDPDNVAQAIENASDAYLLKPIRRDNLIYKLRDLKLLY